MPVIPAIREVETRRILIPGQLKEKVSETSISTNSWA
jgi:hypothetical protein